MTSLLGLRPGPPPLERLSVVARTNDGNRWQTGRCWLWCGRTSARVLWIGPATAGGTTAHLYACESCMVQLADQIINDRLGSDMSEGLDGKAVRWSHGPPRGRHRRRT